MFFGMHANFRASFDDDEEEDYDDTPLFTRTSSLRLLKTVGSKTNNASKANEKPVKEPYSMEYMQASLFATILEDVLTQNRILAQCNNQLRIFKTQSDMTELRGAKYGVMPPTSTDELQGIDHKKLECEQYKLDKLVADRNHYNDILTSTYLALALRNSFSPLVEHRKATQTKLEYRTNLVEEEARNRNTRRELIRMLRQQRNRIKSTIYETNLTVDRLKSNVEDAALHKETRFRYSDKWENARSEQLSARIQRKESKPRDAIAFYRRKTEEEQRIHSELEIMNNIQIDELLQKLDKWCRQYDIDLEKVELKIQLKRNALEDQHNLRLQMEERYAEHEAEMNGWIQFKDDREKARLYHLQMTNAAISVQAWWRGLLVRLELGPYKPVKKKKGGKVQKEKK